MLTIRFFLLLILAIGWVSLQAQDIKKWTDENGKVHYGDIIGYSQKVEILEVNDPVPEVTEGEKLMRLKNDLYFEELEIKRKEKLLDYRQALVKKQKQQRKDKNKAEKKLDSDRRACIKAKLKIEDIKDDLREGYSTKRGVQLEKKRRQQQRRVDAYC
jgi:hypothetical protein